VRQISDLKQSFSHGIVIVDAALMIETGGYKMYRRLIVVTCSPELQIERIMERDGMSEADARARMRSQMPSEEKVKLADYVIDTSGTLGQTRDQVEAIYRDLVELETQLGNGLSPF
jgi:dephospho-CoA kinase